MPKTKVLHLLQSGHFSGAENVVCQIISMYENDENVEMVYCSKEGPVRKQLEDRNITFYSMNELNFREARKIVNKYKPDIIHAHDTKASVIASLFANKKTVISHMHVNHESMNKINLKTLLYLFCMIRIKHIFWVSNSSFNNFIFKNNLRNKSSILYNVINIDLLEKEMLKDKKKYNYDLIFIGRLTYQKNPERLIHILSIVREQIPNIRMAIVGRGVLLDKIIELVKKNNLEDNIFFLGYKKNPLKVLYNSKIMVMTSRFEGTPMSGLEAMALGVPIISTPTDGLVDLIEDNKTGFLSNNDTILAEKIIEVLKNKELQNKLSINTKKKSLEINDLELYKKQLTKNYF